MYNNFMSALDDGELIVKVSKGDEAAFISLYDRYKAQVFGLALRMLGDLMQAEEATQDTFLKIWSRAHLFSADRGSFLVWALTIARRTALDRLRLEARRPAISNFDDPDEQWNSLPDAGSNSDENRWRSLALVVQGLPADQRLVIELAYYQGFSQSEIAELLGWPLGTVKTRLRAAMSRLRQAWQA